MFCLLNACLVTAQEGRLRGKVSSEKEPLIAATVSLGEKTMVAGPDGKFSFSERPGSYALTITHAGYKTIERDLNIKADSTIEVEFLMEPAGILDGVVVISSRSSMQRSSINTPVPVDVFSSKVVRQTGQSSLVQMLNFVSPSINVSRELLNEPISFRNLDPQHVLITLNGMRYHNQALFYNGAPKGSVGKGSVGNDLNSIPFSGIEAVEILRDGASAQYGSDAIAGVVNLRLKQATGKTEMNLHTGQYYKGDGEKFSIDAYRGFSLLNKGFVSVAGSFQFRKPTYRGGVYDDRIYKNNKQEDDSLILVKKFDRKKVIGNIGNIQQWNAGILVNGAYKVRQGTELYATASFSIKKLRREAEYRFPKDTGQVNRFLFPHGLTPISTPITRDLTLTAGVKGKSKNQWQWDIATSFGNNTLVSQFAKSNNASQTYLGENAPTKFKTGSQVYNQFITDLNFSKKYKGLPGHISLFNLGWGMELRWENFKTGAGEEASYSDPDTSLNTNTQAGAQGNVGILPKDVVNEDRIVTGAYIDMETEVKNKFLLNLAGRYEYYDDFGSNLAGKLALRYKVLPGLSVRASLGNGFRAPSLQQRYSKSIQNAYILGAGGVWIPSIKGIFPYDTDVARAFNIPAPKAEKSVNISGGFTGSISSPIRFTVDAYWIQIRDRVVLTGVFDTTDAEVKTILENVSAQTGTKVEQVQFFANAISTHTKGIDVVLSGNWNYPKSALGIVLAANLSNTQLIGKIKTTDKLKNDSLLFNIEEKTRLEKGQPRSKIILNLDYKTSNFIFNIRNTQFGKTASTTLLKSRGGAIDTLYESFSSKIITDISVSFNRKCFSITTGVNNVFDVYPDRLKNYGNTQQSRLIYSPEASPFGFNGGYYYLSIGLNF